MKKYLELSLIIMTGLLTSCMGENYYGPQGPGGWGPMMQMHYGYGGMFMWIIFLIVIGLLIYIHCSVSENEGADAYAERKSLGYLKETLRKRRNHKGRI